MKFANIDDAITEAAKKPVPKLASPKADPKKVAPKKGDPKGTPTPVAPAKKPAEPKKAAAPVAAPKKKATSSKVPKSVVKKKKSVAPAPAAEPETREEPATEPEQKPAEPKPTQGSDSSERPKFAPRWLQSKPRGIGDRLKSAWKGFTAKSGQDLGKAGTSYKSVFHEIHKLMEQLQLVEAMLQEQSLNESYDAGTVNNLYEHRNTIRSVLVEQIVREELYTHNVTIAELDRRQRAALMKTVNVRANALWEGMNQMEEGKLGRLAAAGLAGAAMMGGAKNAEAQSTTPQQTVTAPVPNDSVQTGVSRDMGLAQTKAGFELDRRGIDRQGARMTPKQNPDGTWSVTIDARKQPTTGTPQMEESYTLEEWMGMIGEAGYSLEEGNAENKEKKNAYTDSQSHKRGEEVIASNHPDFIRKRGRGVVQGRIPSKTPSKDTEGLVSENTVSRLQKLAGIKQLNS
jgi:hypothetical protein